MTGSNGSSRDSARKAKKKKVQHYESEASRSLPVSVQKQLKALKKGREKGLSNDWQVVYNSARDVVVWVCPKTGKVYDRLSKALRASAGWKQQEELSPQPSKSGSGASKVSSPTHRRKRKHDRAFPGSPTKRGRVRQRKHSSIGTDRSASSISPPKRRPFLRTEVVEYLNAWMTEHIAHPYPTQEEKTDIMADTGLELKQVNNWFVNHRMRNWKHHHVVSKRVQSKKGKRTVNFKDPPDTSSSSKRDRVRPRKNSSTGRDTSDKNQGGYMKQASATPGSPSKRGVRTLPTQAVEYLNAWMTEHIDNPYPTKEEKTKMMADTGIALNQLNNWFVSKRMRYWKPQVVGRGKSRKELRALPTEVVEYLNAWMTEHVDHPYPTKEEKAKIMAHTGLAPVQLQNWFGRNRKRYDNPQDQFIDKNHKNRRQAQMGVSDVRAKPKTADAVRVEKCGRPRKKPTPSINPDAKQDDHMKETATGTIIQKTNKANPTTRKLAVTNIDSGKPRALPTEVVEYLDAWMTEHIDHPYPTKEEKAKLMAHTGLGPLQLQNWFGRNRKRYYSPQSQAVDKVSDNRRQAQMSVPDVKAKAKAKTADTANVEKIGSVDKNSAETFEVRKTVCTSSGNTDNMKEPPDAAPPKRSPPCARKNPPINLRNGANGNTGKAQEKENPVSKSDIQSSNTIPKTNEPNPTSRRKREGVRTIDYAKMAKFGIPEELPTEAGEDSRRELSPSPSEAPSRRLPTKTVEYLNAWMASPEHIDHPYPTKEEKATMMADTGIALNQLNNWFVSKRMRSWKPQIVARGKILPKDNAPASTHESTTASSIAPKRPRGPPRKNLVKRGRGRPKKRKFALPTSDVHIDEPSHHKRSNHGDKEMSDDGAKTKFEISEDQQNRHIGDTSVRSKQVKGDFDDSTTQTASYVYPSWLPQPDPGAKVVLLKPHINGKSSDPNMHPPTVENSTETRENEPPCNHEAFKRDHDGNSCFAASNNFESHTLFDTWPPSPREYKQLCPESIPKTIPIDASSMEAMIREEYGSGKRNAASTPNNNNIAGKKKSNDPPSESKGTPTVTTRNPDKDCKPTELFLDGDSEKRRVTRGMRGKSKEFKEYAWDKVVQNMMKSVEASSDGYWV